MKIYRGSPVKNSGGLVEVWAEQPDSDPVAYVHGVLPHVVKHSPSGFSWGYGGSGPSELARCLLIDHFGEGGRCARCEGTGRVVYLEAIGHGSEEEFPTRPATAADGHDDAYSCPACWGERYTFAWGMYQAFKNDVVATWPQEEGWTLTSEEIDAWLRTEGVRWTT